ncbi:MAG TPA: GNAT family N-acetyltransferase [Vicinamibacterales bacterium]
MTATVSIATATPDDAAAVAEVRNAAADALTRLHGQGHWSGFTTSHGVLRGINTSRVLVARSGHRIIGTLRLATRRPWAIDPSFFADSRRPLYLVDMAVTPSAQRQGTGRELLRAAVKTAEEWKADAIRLDAYDHAAGAGPFYEKCGFKEVGRATYRGVPLIYYQFLL